MFIEDGIDKSPIRGPEGEASKGLADDQSFELPKFADAFYKDPSCDNALPMWQDYRKEMVFKKFDYVEEDEDHKAATSMDFLVYLFRELSRERAYFVYPTTTSKQPYKMHQMHRTKRGGRGLAT